MSERGGARDGDGVDAPIDLSPWAAPTPPRGIAKRVMDAVQASKDVDEERPSPRPSPSLRTNGARWRGMALGLAGAAAAAAITWALWPHARPGGPPSGHVVAGAPSKLALGERTVALLGAGADVTWARTPDGLAIAQAEGNVTYQHAGPERLVITTPLAEVHTAGASLNVEVPMSSPGSSKKIAIAGVAGAGVAAAVVIAVYEGKAEVRAPATSPRVVEAGAQVAVAPPAPSRPAFSPVAKVTRDRAQREALAAAIAAARAAKTSPPPPAGGGVPGGAALTTGPAPGAGGAVDLTPGQLSKEEIRTSVREVLPLLVDCYTLVLDKHPRLGGKVIAKLVVDAEPELGTIVTMEDDSEVAMKGAAADADPTALATDLGDFRQCLGATLETIVLPPLGDQDGGRVEITYPFVFSPSEEEADTYAGDAPAPTPPAPAPKPKRAPPAAEDDVPVGMTAEELLVGAETAAKRSDWPGALKRAEQAMRASDAAPQTRARAAMVAALAACNTKNARKARAHYQQATPSSKTLIRQRCEANGIDVVPGDDDMLNPFDGPKRARPATPPAGELKDPFR